jgi:hypothetical protein
MSLRKTLLPNRARGPRGRALCLDGSEEVAGVSSAMNVLVRKLGSEATGPRNGPPQKCLFRQVFDFAGGPAWTRTRNQTVMSGGITVESVDLGDGRDRLDDHDRDHALQGLAALNEDNMAMTVMSLRAAMKTACKFRA